MVKKYREVAVFLLLVVWLLWAIDFSFVEMFDSFTDSEFSFLQLVVSPFVGLFMLVFVLVGWVQACAIAGLFAHVLLFVLGARPSSAPFSDFFHSKNGESVFIWSAVFTLIFLTLLKL